jgi:hypothetical protein
MAKYGIDWLPDQNELLKELYPDNLTSDLVAIVGHSKTSIHTQARKLNLKKSAEFLASSASGRRSKSPIGKEYISNAGYLMRKVNNDPNEANRWKPVHVIVWEEKHGAVPENCMVAFRDGNKQNIIIENLELVTRREILNRNTIQRYPKEVIGLLQLQCKLKRTIERRMKDDA